MTIIRLTTIPWAPPAFQGQVRDLAVRWALEESGLPYELLLLAPENRRTAQYRARQPFGQIPVLDDDGICVFESGAIVLHLAEKTKLLPADPAARARARSWMFAALNSVDPCVGALGDIDHFHADEPWAQERRPQAVRNVQSKLDAVAAQLDGRQFLAGEFSAADIMMIMVLRALRHTRLVADTPILNSWRDACEARPAFKRALESQLETFARHAPAN